MFLIRCPLCRTSNVTLNNNYDEIDICPVCFEDTCRVLTCNHHLCYECFSKMSNCHNNSSSMQNIDILIINNSYNSNINNNDITVIINEYIGNIYNNNLYEVNNINNDTNNE
jgi:hypothetical protein